MNQPEEPVEGSQDRIAGDFLPEIRRARFQRLTIYEVEESELLLLERGAPDSILLNIAVALLALAVSLTATLLTATFQSERHWTVFVVIAVLGYMVGVTLLLIWWRSRTSVAACVKNIRQRLATDWLDDPEEAAAEVPMGEVVESADG